MFSAKIINSDGRKSVAAARLLKDACVFHSELRMSTARLLSNDPEDMELKNDPSKHKVDMEANRYLMDDDRSWLQRLSNQTVLGVTCFLFFLFVVAEIIGALVRIMHVYRVR